MYWEARTELVPLIIVASGLEVTPLGVEWPLHRALTRAGTRRLDVLVDAFGDLLLHEDPEIGVRSRLADDSFVTAVTSSLLQQVGTGLLARWVVDEQVSHHWRRRLLLLSPLTVQSLAYVGKRWATLSNAILKNLDTSAGSWASTVEGYMFPPIVRQPLAAK